MSKARVAAVGAACLIPALAALAVPRLHASTTTSTTRPVVAVAPAPKPLPPPPAQLVAVRVVDTLQPGEALSSALAREGCSANDTSALVRSLKGKLDARAVRAGLQFEVVREPLELRRFELHTFSGEGIPRTVTAVREEKPITVDDGDASFDVTVKDAPIETQVAGVSGTVRSSLYDAMIDQGEDANLVNRFVDVFAWNVDFYKQTRAGDQFKVLVEKRYAGGRFLGYGRVLAAEYVNAGAVYRGFKFESKDGKFAGVFDDEGNALQRAFLKAPLEVTRITSRYGQRMDPFGNGEGFHHGIDYGAPLGTPIWSVADGVVEMARRNGGAGNMVKIRHMNGYETEYFHMVRFADGMKPGVHVKQKQVIGYVGSTGYSTGPHLHFGMFQNGQHVDPSKQKLPNVAPVPRAYSAEYKAFVEPLLVRLKALASA